MSPKEIIARALLQAYNEAVYATTGQRYLAWEDLNQHQAEEFLEYLDG